MELPKGNTREDIKSREKFIKDFYAQWISKHNDKKLWNDNLQSYIHIKFISIDETREKAARKYESTIAVTRLDDILSKFPKDEVGVVEDDIGVQNTELGLATVTVPCKTIGLPARKQGGTPLPHPQEQRHPLMI